jgi:hypothetical protein
MSVPPIVMDSYHVHQSRARDCYACPLGSHLLLLLPHAVRLLTTCCKAPLSLSKGSRVSATMMACSTKAG